jgi:hypothetical protein
MNQADNRWINLISCKKWHIYIFAIHHINKQADILNQICLLANYIFNLSLLSSLFFVLVFPEMDE